MDDQKYPTIINTFDGSDLPDGAYEVHDTWPVHDATVDREQFVTRHITKFPWAIGLTKPAALLYVGPKMSIDDLIAVNAVHVTTDDSGGRLVRLHFENLNELLAMIADPSDGDRKIHIDG